jgi:hypothetical protein
MVHISSVQRFSESLKAPLVLVIVHVGYLDEIH